MRAAALLAATSCGLAACAAGGPPIGDAAPLPIVRAAHASLGSSAPQRGGTRAVRRRPAVAPGARTAEPTPPGPRRPHAAARAGAISPGAAARLAAPACAQQADAVAGRFPDAVLERGSGRALALVSRSVAAALLGLPVQPPEASLPAREQLARALAAQDGGEALAPRIRAYAGALGIQGCG